VRQLVYSTAGATASKLALGAFTVAAARALGATPSADFFAWAFTWMGALALLTQGAIQPALTAHLGTATDTAARARALAAGQRIAHRAGAAAAALLVLCVPWLAPASAQALPLAEKVCVLGSLAVALYWVSACSAEMAALAWAERAGLAAGMGTLSPLAGALALMLAPPAFKGVAASCTFAVASFAEYAALAVVRRASLQLVRCAHADVARLLRPMAGWAVVGLAQTLVPVFDLLLASQAGHGAVAILTYATRPSSVVNAILGIGVSAALTAAFAAAHVRGRDAFVCRARYYAGGFALLGAAPALGLSLWADALAAALYGTAAMQDRSLQTVAQVMALYAWTTVLWAFGGVIARALTAGGRTMPVATMTLVAAAVKLALSVALYDRFGLEGLAGSSLAQAAVFSAGLYWVFERASGAARVLGRPAAQR
jgi:peptidoglycan biosynthesis protein MviN/MurJ (putative lipid II flippase)